MVGMAFPLDVIFVDRHGSVLAVYPRLEPGRRSGWHGRARYAIEVPAGTIEITGTAVGDVVAWLTADADPASTEAALIDAGILTASNVATGEDARRPRGER
jgi:hypothetical protein